MPRNRLNVQQAGSRWRNNLSQSTESIREGVNGVTQAPGERAVAQQETLRANFNRAVDDGTWAQNTGAVTLTQWKDAMLKKGVPRIAAGAAAGQPHYEQFAAQFYPYLEAGLRTLDAMPRGDLEQNIARASQMIRHNAEFRRNRR